MITDRALKILEATVQEFIETGEPVSSAKLFNNYDFGIRPAMIRCELEGLAQLGFLEHPYHSAGRIPSDKGYELFAQHIISQPNQKASLEDETISNLFEKKAWMELLETISSKLGIFGILCEHENIHKNGLQNLVERLEWETRDEIKAIIRDVVEIDSRLGTIEKIVVEETPEVFIGKKNEITTSKNLAVIGGSYETDGIRVMMFAIGPKRMDYKKTLKIFKNLKRSRKIIDKNR